MMVLKFKQQAFIYNSWWHKHSSSR